jgi:quinol monooxygenase YgiN
VNTEILSLAVLEPHAGKETETLALLREFYSMMHRKGYSRDVLYRDSKHPGLLLHTRLWKSEAMRDEAHNDPEVHRYWRSMADLCEVIRAYETLEELFSTMHKAEGA